ncbi:unnamed protein product [Urochloa humidicola]
MYDPRRAGCPNVVVVLPLAREVVSLYWIGLRDHCHSSTSFSLTALRSEPEPPRWNSAAAQIKFDLALHLAAVGADGRSTHRP